MSTLFWQGGATAVAQVSSAAFASFNTGSTRTITIGGITVNNGVDATDLATTLTNFKNYLNGLTHPFFSAMTWSSDATHIIATSDIAGVPHTITAATTGTGATTNTVTVTTLSAGPNDWSTIANWYTALGTVSAAVPASTDTVIIANSSVDIRWGLATGVTGVTLIRVEQTYTGKIGLDYKVFVTGSDGSSNPSYPEYRPVYLAIGVITLRIGDAPASGSPSGSSRILIDIGSTTTCTADIINSASNSAETNRPAIRFLGNKSAHILNVRSAQGGVGICNEVPGETSTLGTVNVADTTSTSKVTTGFGLTLTTWLQSGGSNVLASNATVTTVTVNGGNLRLEGTGATTTLNCYGGTVNSNNSGTTATINLQGGTLNAFGSAVARTFSAVNLYPNSQISYDPTVVTVTAFTGQRRLTLATS